MIRGVVVIQLVDRSLPTLEVRGSNPVLGKLFITYISTKINKKRPGMAHFLKKNDYICFFSR